MKITAITRYNHGEMFAALNRIGWTQSELALRTGLSNKTVADIVNLVRRPTPAQADAIQLALGQSGEFLDVLAEWPETFAGVGRGFRVEQTAKVSPNRLHDNPEVLQIAAPDGGENAELVAELVDRALDRLPPKTQQVLRLRFWEGKTYKQIGKAINTSSQVARYIEFHGLRILRHPERIKTLKPT